MTKTNKMPELGTISHGTMVPEDLAAAFMPVVREYCDRETYLECAASWLDAVRDKSDEDKSEAIDAMFNALDAIAPPYCYFGAHEGDGSDYGFWQLDQES